MYKTDVWYYWQKNLHLKLWYPQTFFQGHLIKPVLPRISSIICATKKDKNGKILIAKEYVNFVISFKEHLYFVSGQMLHCGWYFIYKLVIWYKQFELLTFWIFRQSAWIELKWWSTRHCLSCVSHDLVGVQFYQNK